VSLQLKPDVTAPGVDVLSSVPAHAFELLDGTSMATPHVAGGAALLLQRHPTWTVEQVKSALASTGDEVHPTAIPARSPCCAKEAAGSTWSAPTSR
jgi:Subtilisin-like serine proteases